MKSQQFMLSALLGLAAMAAGCSDSRVIVPHEYESPYPGTKLWAVAPLANDSGTTLVDGVDFAEKLSQRLQQVQRIQMVPMNRVLATMDRLRMPAVTSPAHAQALIEAMGVDGLIVGSVTAWDPYEPPKIGGTIQLYAGRGLASVTMQDTRQLRGASTAGGSYGGGTGADPLRPVAEASGYFDATNGAVLKRLEQYAHGRAQEDSPAGWRRYLISMDLYSEFVSHELMRRLFAREWERLHAGTQRGAPERQEVDKDLSGPPQRDPLRDLGVRDMGIF